MSLSLLLILLACCFVLLVLELRGVRTTLSLSFKGDVKRETAFLAQYGQSVATPIAAGLVYSFQPDQPWRAAAVIAATAAASVACFVVKRLCGRARPNRENAGKFLGPSWKHDNKRESFPSSHSACAVALTTALVHLYPQAAVVLWILAGLTAGLRWVLDAHFPSDVFGGIAVGYGVAYAVIAGFHGIDPGIPAVAVRW
jgi:membrane-associated phospholipid phosphatase